MLRKLFTISFILLLSSMLFAQQRAIIKSTGDVIKLQKYGSFEEALEVSKFKSTIDKEAILTNDLFKSSAAVDTLSYSKIDPGWEGATKARFGYDPYDVMVQWFVAPTKLNINAIGFYTNDVVDPNSAVEMKIVKVNWTKDQITALSAKRLGYYPAAGYEPFPIAPFQDDEVTTGDWVDIAGNAPTAPFGEDLWSDDGIGAPATPVQSEYVWVEMNLLAFEPEIQEGEIFGVVLKNISPLGTPVLRVQSASGLIWSGFKYYNAGRLVTTPPTMPEIDNGWWIRPTYTWDMAAIVTYTGDTPPVISDIDNLPTTLSTADRVVTAVITDDNPSGGPKGVKTATLKYSVNGGADVAVVMTGAGDVFSGTIPGQAAGSSVSYYIVAEDVGGKVTESVSFTYNIFKPSGASTLLVLNGMTEAQKAYPVGYYFRQVPEFKFDQWYYGALSAELLNNYKHIFEICTNGPLDDNDEAVKTWLTADPTRNYFLSGEEYLGWDNNYTDMTYAAGDFEYDVLGIAASYNDISFDGTAGQALPSRLFAVQGSELGGALYTAFTAYGTDSLQYDPIYELGLSTSQWIDGFDAAPGVEVDMNVESRGIAGAPAVQNKPAMAHHVTANGNHVVFSTYDPLAINSSPSYFWWSDSVVAPHYKAIEYFNIILGVEENNLNPNQYNLAQNYPNPFNPTTTITYSVAQKGNVSLKVFNLLGQEVATLVDAVKSVGTHQVNFDASKISSGVYFYTITSGEFVSTKKMMLIK